jgi:hypothetical protein
MSRLADLLTEVHDRLNELSNTTVYYLDIESVFRDNKDVIIEIANIFNQEGKLPLDQQTLLEIIKLQQRIDILTKGISTIMTAQIQNQSLLEEIKNSASPKKRITLQTTDKKELQKYKLNIEE